MSSTQQPAEAPAGVEAIDGKALLDQLLIATRRSKSDEDARMADLVGALVAQSNATTIKFDLNVNRSIRKAIAEIDRTLSDQLNAIMHDEKFLKLEGSWRGLKYLVDNTNSTTNLKIKVLNATKANLASDMEDDSEFDQSHLWKLVYESGFGQAGGEPFGALIGDYEWGPGDADVNTLQGVAGVAGASFAPFISAPAPAMFGISDWTQLNQPRNLADVFNDHEHTRWRSFRDTSDSRYVSLVMPRVLARSPYGAESRERLGFDYQEAPMVDDHQRAMQHSEYCWMNAAYALGARMTNAFADTGLCTAIRGETSGGKVDNLPGHVFHSESGDQGTKCPTEVDIPDRRETEASQLGFIPFVHYKTTNSAIFYSVQTTQRPKLTDDDSNNDNARITARLPYVMVASRFAHSLKIKARQWIGSSADVEECERKLHSWINDNYVNSLPAKGEQLRIEKPLREASVQVREVPGQPGVYNAIAFLRPWLQMEELNASIRMVARIPGKVPT